MTQKTPHCTGTTFLTDPAAIAAAVPYPVEQLYGRKICTTCGGAVLRKSDGTLRKHVVGSNKPVAV